MADLPVQKNLINVITSDGDTLRGTLICDCGCEAFYILHTGRQTKGILSACLVAKRGEICIKARCAACSNEYTLKKGWESQAAFTEFIWPKIRDNRWQMTVSYHYEENTGMRDGRWTDEYIDIAIDGTNEDHPKPLRIFE